MTQATAERGTNQMSQITKRSLHDSLAVPHGDTGNGRGRPDARGQWASSTCERRANCGLQAEVATKDLIILKIENSSQFWKSLNFSALLVEELVAVVINAAILCKR